MTGFFVLDKPGGMSSMQAVARLKRRLHPTAAGHMGTLDPMATGVLPVAVGRATRLFDILTQDHKKTYVADFTFGLESDTLDTTGTVMPCGAVPTRAEIEAALPAFIGELGQVPPDFSAVHVDGKRAYALARRGQSLTLAQKRVTVFDFTLLSYAPPVATFAITCAGGTYVRALARDLAAALGMHAVMSALRRTAVGGFTLATACDPDAVTADRLLAPDAVLHYDTYTLLPGDKPLLHGLPVVTALPNGNVWLYHGEALYALGAVSDGLLHPGIILCT
ncbi:MAG: tRNA pseudouridine(55) synthase TruB [Clostridiales bacterium]|nr:tRNA pseudouridine(55) synthase TruB [Clostridiales bacterium]